MLPSRWTTPLLILLLSSTLSLVACGQPASDDPISVAPSAADDVASGAADDSGAADEGTAGEADQDDGSSMSNSDLDAVPAGDGFCAGELALPEVDDDFVDLGNGLLSKDLVVGDGALVEEGTPVQVQYAGFLEDGRMFDSSCNRGGTPLGVTVGAGGVIDGWDLGLQGMNVGGRRVLVIPAALAYKDRGAPRAGIGPGATLIFDLQVVSAQ